MRCKQHAVVCHTQSFLQKALMPLHKPKCVGMYHQQLAYCVTQARHRSVADTRACLPALATMGSI